jgi:hypothetical protein
MRIALAALIGGSPHARNNLYIKGAALMRVCSARNNLYIKGAALVRGPHARHTCRSARNIFLIILRLSSAQVEESVHYIFNSPATGAVILSAFHFGHFFV